MKQLPIHHSVWPILLLALVVGITIVVPASISLAQSGGGYEISGLSASEGGGSSSGGIYTINGILTQPDSGPVSGGSFNLEGELQPDPNAGGGGGGQDIYLPIIFK